MSVSNTITVQATMANGTVVGTAETVTSGSNPFVSELIPANQTDLAVAFAFTNSKLKSFVAHSDVAMVIETNDGSSPQETIHLVAGKTYEWSLTGSYMGSSAASPFGGDVTGLYVTNTTTGTLTVSAIVDPT